MASRSSIDKGLAGTARIMRHHRLWQFGKARRHNIVEPDLRDLFRTMLLGVVKCPQWADPRQIAGREIRTEGPLSVASLGPFSSLIPLFRLQNRSFGIAERFPLRD